MEATHPRVTEYDTTAPAPSSEIQAEMSTLLSALSSASPSHQSIAEELLALSAIFDIDDTPSLSLFHPNLTARASSSPRPWSWKPDETLRLLISTTAIAHSSAIETPLHLVISLPPDYPETSPPLIQLHDRYIGNFLVSAELWGEVARTFMHEQGGVEWNQGEVCVYEGVEWSRTRIGEWLEEKEEERRKVEVLRAGAAVYRIENVSLEECLEEENTPDSTARPASISTREVSCPQIFSSEAIVDRKSVFVGHAARVKSPDEVHAVLGYLLSDKKIARATHNISAYRLTTPEGVLQQDNDDDGESAAGSRLAHLLALLDVNNVLVVVTRWYGGIQLGADRFKHINAAGRDALLAGKFLPIDEAPKSSKKPHHGGNNNVKRR